MRFRSLQRMKAPTRCPMRPRIGRSRSDVGGDRSPRRWRSVIAVNALDRTPRPCGFSLTTARARRERMRDPKLDRLRSRSARDRRPAGSCIARIFRGDVPLPVPDLPEPSRNGSIAAPLMGFMPFAVLILTCAGGEDVVHLAGPTCRFLSVRPDRLFLVGRSTVCCRRCTH
jgi:hypothetical protein